MIEQQNPARKKRRSAGTMKSHEAIEETATTAAHTLMLNGGASKKQSVADPMKSRDAESIVEPIRSY
ncbi:unnamed protein product [Peronospora belbahrii]|uniref:Uncharacterized protein n=1 Tax=Peronospora belbahrii TaxID=622444 RepID=A0ABN8D785_9STRA|nr:unnamed protein product [Peronospora belbahrii]